MPTVPDLDNVWNALNLLTNPQPCYNLNIFFEAEVPTMDENTFIFI